MTTRGDVLELAILGELLVSELHGYELRKRLNTTLGTIRTLSYGSLYPCLKRLVLGGWIEQTDAPARGLGGRRGRIVYRLTPAGRRRLAESLADVDPAAWDDESFTVRFSLFTETSPDARLEILQGRRAHLLRRRASLRSQLQRADTRWDRYTVELQRHGLENLEREIEWLDDLITTERSGAARPSPPASGEGSPDKPQDPGAADRPTATSAADQVRSTPPTDRPYPKEN